MHAKLGLLPKKTGFLGITFYRCILCRCILHFQKPAENSVFFIPIMGDLRKKKFHPSCVLLLIFAAECGPAR
jgi:hypothetical protein